MEMAVFIVNCEHVMQSYASTVVLVLSVSVIQFGIQKLNFKENSRTIRRVRRQKIPRRDKQKL